MLKNHLKIALRTLRRHRGYVLINVIGLAIGVACCLLIVQFVRYELSYDRFHEKADRIYRIASDWGDFSIPTTNPPFVRRLEASYPEIKQAWVNTYSGLVSHEDRTFREGGIFFVNPAFFDVFTAPILQGAFKPDRPLAALITPEMARKYFGDSDPIGRRLTVDNQFELEVTGVVGTFPDNAHFHPDFLVSWATLDAFQIFNYESAWGNNAIYTYLLFPPEIDPVSFAEELPAFIERQAGQNWNGAELILQPLTDIHLRSHHNDEIEPNGNVAYIYVLVAIAAFILLIACINFVNLATARSVDRAREVGVRKVAGADRSQLIRQFLSESLVLVSLAVFVAVGLVYAFLPWFKSLAARPIAFDLLGDGFLIPVLVGFVLLVGLLAGVYPAIVLSSFRPAQVLKGSFARSGHGRMLRKGLVVFQFAISIALIVGTGTIYNQLSYLRSAGLGFDQDQVVQIDFPDAALVRQYVAFKKALAAHPGIEQISIASERLPSELLNGSGTQFEGSPDPMLDVPLRTVAIGHDFFETLGVEPIAGRTFREEFATDSAGVILNATAWRLVAADAGVSPDDPIPALGKRILYRGTSGPLVGVVPDFNMASLREVVEPVIFFFDADWYDTAHIRLDRSDIPGAMAFVEETWRRFFPSWPLEYAFVDQGFDAVYRSEERLAQLFTIFAGFALFVGCLGLFGLASFTAAQRTKEIGVRKVLGASVGSIVVLLSREISWLVVAAVVVAAPVAWYGMSRWLEGFAYRIDVAWWLFPLAGGIALAIAWLTVSYQSIRAALADPVKSLRYE